MESQSPQNVDADREKDDGWQAASLKAELEQTRRQLAVAQEQLRTLIERLSAGVCIVDRQGLVRLTNPSAERMFSAPPGGLVGERFRLPLVKGEFPEILVSRPGEESLIAELHIEEITWQGEAMFLAVLNDITRRVQAEESIRLAGKVLESTAEGVFVTDTQACMVMVNRSFCEITGFAESDVLGRPATDFQSDVHDQRFFQQMWESLAITSGWQGEVWNRRKDGEIYPEWLTISTVRGTDGTVLNYVGIFTDISTRKKAEERLRYLATHDALTDLPNRDLINDRLVHAISRANRNRRLAAVLMLDLDHFKKINDTFGHAVGDEVLQAVAQLLRNSVRRSDTVGRLSGDEFTVILEDITTAEDSVLVALKILKAFEQPLQLSALSIPLTPSIGISLYPLDGENVAALLKHADEAMYRSKLRKNTYQLYSRLTQGRRE